MSEIRVRSGYIEINRNRAVKLDLMPGFTEEDIRHAIESIPSQDEDDLFEEI